MIHQVRLVNFKSHRDTTIDLGPLTVLVGANASGKTSILRGLYIAAETARHGRDHGASLLSSSFATSRLCREGHSEFQIFVTGEEAGDGPWSVETSFRIEPTGWAPRRFMVDGKRPQLGEAQRITTRGATLARLSPDRIRSHSPVAGTLNREFDGANIASQLARLRLKNDSAFERIQVDMRLVVPSFDSVVLEAVEEKEGSGYALKLNFDGVSEIAATDASDGTLLALAVLTLVHSPNPPGVVLFDDIELGLHPTAQLTLMRLLERIATNGSKVQFVATAHSPYILSAIDPRYVYVTAIKDGISHVKSLSQHPLAVKRLQVLDAGEFWSSEDESWVLAP